MFEKTFYLPFLIGMIYLFIIIIFRFYKWINGLSKIDKLRLFQSFKTRRFVSSIKEAFMEGLIHRKIFFKNPVLGYMHMSLAFGWFLLIVTGHIETMVADKSVLVPVYRAVFFRYFDTGSSFTLSKLFALLMDLLLLFVLSGLFLAVLKRFRKQVFGIKKTTKLKTGDKIALTSLWLIFPLRLFAESITAGVFHNGSFLTGAIGRLLMHFGHFETLLEPVWFAYSLTLGFFFIALPNSRYMHIPTEILYIFVRNAGIQLKKLNNTYTNIQVFSCSRCGICLDNCQLSTAGIKDSQSVYLLKNIRNHSLDDEQLFNCLLCGKCKVDCPVGIETIDLRITQRIESTIQYNSTYDYLKTSTSPKVDLVYFAGCMTHLTPGIVKSMLTIFEEVQENYWFIDKEKAPCCGRPLMLAGQYNAASELIRNNSIQILESGAKTLVVSCPICYKVFKEDYDLPNIQVLTHIEYILQQLENKKLQLNKSNKRVVYHDPCELGRGMELYDPPRQLLSKVSTVIPIKKEKQLAYCCGGSLGNLKITQAERKLIRNQALNDYLTYTPELLITACPLCKKTFSRSELIPVKDISEIVVESFRNSNKISKNNTHEVVFEEEFNKVDLL